MSADKQGPVQPILQLIMDGRTGEAVSAIESEFGGSMPDYLRLNGDDAPPPINRSERQDQQNRYAVSHLFAFSAYLMERELWEDALTVLDRAIQLSKDMDENYFRGEFYFRKALCCKMLGRRAEMMKPRRMLRPDAMMFLRHKVLGVRDLD